MKRERRELVLFLAIGCFVSLEPTELHPVDQNPSLLQRNKRSAFCYPCCSNMPLCCSQEDKRGRHNGRREREMRERERDTKMDTVFIMKSALLKRHLWEEI